MRIPFLAIMSASGLLLGALYVAYTVHFAGGA